ncbi:MAG: GGDEF domain-containing protein [Magnetococcales bacterium]|nr:GGDEF domain-containing protein [Magnetococcales bacterium]
MLRKAVENSLLFRDVDPDLLVAALTPGGSRKIAPGEVLIAPGQNNDKVYLLISGHLSIHLDRLEDPPIRMVKPGETVGELSLIGSTRTSAWVVGAEESDVVVIEQETLWSLINRETMVARNLLRIISGWIVSGNKKAIATNRQIEELEGIARVDSLTGVYNRRSFDESYHRLLARCQVNGSPFSLILLDVDHFKNYNDTQGHQAGDRALMALANVITDTIRPGDLAARYGGEEFAVILPETIPQDAAKVGERMRLSVMSCSIVQSDGTPLPGITISLGVGCLRDGATEQTILKEADDNLYRAKEGGRNRVCFTA